MSSTLSKYALDNGGFLKLLLVDYSLMSGPSLSNPSVCVTGTGEALVNIRNLNYVLYHSERGEFEHPWGPLCYLHPENDQRLVTHNILCKLDADLNASPGNVVDMGMFDENPVWEFVGLEDGRLVEWEGRLYLCGFGGNCC